MSADTDRALFFSDYSDGGAKVNVPILDSFTECTTEIDVIITSGASMGVVNASS